MKKKELQEKYDSTSEVYNSRYAEVQTEKYKKMLASLDFQGRILDLGSGTGLLREFLQLDVVGMDLSFHMLKKSTSEGIQADAELLPFKPRSFDYILSFTTLQNLPEPEIAIKEARRVLKKNGLFICTFLRSFKPKLKSLLKQHFRILEEKEIGEDFGFVLKP